MKKIIIAEDNKEFQDGWKEAVLRYNLADKITLLQAFDFPEARQMVRDHADADLVAIDGTLNVDADGLWLIEELDVIGYKGAILAISSSISMNQLMHEQIVRMFGEGCAHSCEKKYAFANICRILSIDLH